MKLRNKFKRFWKRHWDEVMLIGGLFIALLLFLSGIGWL